MGEDILISQDIVWYWSSCISFHPLIYIYIYFIYTFLFLSSGKGEIEDFYSRWILYSLFQELLKIEWIFENLRLKATFKLTSNPDNLKLGIPIHVLLKFQDPFISNSSFSSLLRVSMARKKKIFQWQLEFLETECFVQ